jgi:HAD superfamily hydrolase (TIGR01509 family)
MPKKRKIAGVLFDWDGTLLNSYEADSAAYLAMFQSMNIPWGLKELARYYSPNWHKVYRAARLHQSRWADADLAWRTAYARQKPKLLPDAQRLLADLRKRYRLGLVTGGDRGRVSRQLRQFHLLHTFSVRVCCDDTVERKPHPQPLLLALRTLRLSAQDCVYVGDTREDVHMARSAGVRTIGVLGPFPTARKLKLSGPDVLLSSLAELPAALNKMQP